MDHSFQKWLRTRTDEPEPVNELLGTALAAAGLGAMAYASPWVRDKANKIRQSFRSKPQIQDKPPEPVREPEKPQVKPNALPDNPEDIFTHPIVVKYYNKVVSDLMLDDPDRLETSNGKQFSGIPSRIEKILKQFIASHVLEGNATWNRVSYPKSIEIIDFLDDIKVKGEQQSLAQRFDADSPRGLTTFVQGEVDAVPGINYQDNYWRKRKTKEEIVAPGSHWENDQEMKALSEILHGLVGTQSHPGFLRLRAAAAQRDLDAIRDGVKVKKWTSPEQYDFLVKAVSWIDKHLPSIEAKAEEEDGSTPGGRAGVGDIS